MSLSIDSRVLFSGASAYAGTLAAWREAEARVRARWEQFLAADGDARRFAFAAYVAALDLEAAVADDLAQLAPLDLAA